jgi:hypothetical protein
MAYPDRVKETTTTTGTGNLTLSGPVVQFRALSAAFANAQSGITLCIADQSGSNWEVSSCTLVNPTTISRDTVLSSSNSDALVNFSAGTKDVFFTFSAADIAKLLSNTSTNTLTNKRITSRVLTLGTGATPAINTDLCDRVTITGLAIAISSMTSGLTGVPVNGDNLTIDITDNGTARSILWGASFEASTVSLPITTIAGQKLTTYFEWNPAASKWRCVGVV